MSRKAQHHPKIQNHSQTVQVALEDHEIETVNFLIEHGESVELIMPSNTPKNTNPDILMRGVIWEMKSPTVNNDNSISRLFYRALTQSTNLIFDLRRLKKSDQKPHNQLMKLATKSRRLNQILIIRKNGQVEEYRKK
jgi:hypothetical protein